MIRRSPRATPLLTPVLVCALVVQGCGDSSEEEAREVPLRQQPEVDVEMIGEGVVSTAAIEFAAAFTPGGDSLYFTRMRTRNARPKIYLSVRDSAGWSQPELAPFAATGSGDVDPFVTPDGSRLYFSSDRPAPVGASRMNTWWVDRQDGGWSEPRTAGPPLNSPSSDVFVSATREGTLYFSSRREDGAQAVYRIERSGEEWSTPERLSFDELRSVGNPLVAPDGEFLVLTAVGPDGSPDLYLACREGERWDEPERLPKGVNSPQADFAPALHPEDGTLVFTSERPGVVQAPADTTRAPSDLYRASFRPAERCD